MPRKPRIRKAQQQCWIGYPRKSTDTEDKQIHSIGDQVKMIEKHYFDLPEEERRNRPLKMLPESESAFRPGRPVFGQIMGMADEGKVHGIIAVQPNRISRNHADTGRFMQALVEGRISCLDTTFGKRYTAEHSNDIFMLTLEGAMSWKDSRDKGDRIREAMRQRAKEGRIMGPARLGYRNVTLTDGSQGIQSVEGEKQKVLRIFQLADTGTYSYSQLANEADKMGLRGKKGARLGTSSIEQLLADPIYKGYYRFMETLTKTPNEAIVPEILWDHVQLVLAQRSKPSGKPKNLSLRELFVFGSLLECPKCGHTLSPYRVKEKNFYYDCKNKRMSCKVRVKQSVLAEQLQPFLQSIHVDDGDMAKLREQLLEEHKQRSGMEIDQRVILGKEYEAVQKSIVEVFGRLKEAEALGIRPEVEKQLETLKMRRDAIQKQLNATHESGSDWIEKVVRCFDLFKLLEEALKYGNARTRELCFDAIGSNYSVDGEKLVCKLRSPLRQKVENNAHSVWWTILDSNQ